MRPGSGFEVRGETTTEILTLRGRMTLQGRSVTRQGRSVKLNRVAAICALAACGLLAGCRQDMQDQPKFIPQRGTDFYSDGRSVRPQVENTVARGQLHEDA